MEHPQNFKQPLPSSSINTDETLNRNMGIWNSFTLGFAVVSPVVGLYAIVGVQGQVTGGGWFAALIICLTMQLFVATVYAELASQFPIAGGAYKWAHLLCGRITGQYAGAIYVSSTIAMLTTTAYTGGIWLAILFGLNSESGIAMVGWGIAFLLLCLAINLAPVKFFKGIIAMGVYAEIVGSFGMALLLFLFFRELPISELFQHLGTGTAPNQLSAFLAALAIAGWAFIGFDACSTTSEETHQPKHSVPRAVFLSLLAVGTVVVFNSAALTLSVDHEVLSKTSSTFDPITPLISTHIGAWAEKHFLLIVIIAFLACGASVVKYTSRIVFSMAREGILPSQLSIVSHHGTPHHAILATVVLASMGLMLGLSDEAVATIISFGTGGLYAMFATTTGVALFSRLTGRWNPALGELKLGIWGLIINSIAFLWSVFELINIAWPRSYMAAPDAPWWQLWAVPLVLAGILVLTTLVILIKGEKHGTQS